VDIHDDLDRRARQGPSRRAAPLSDQGWSLDGVALGIGRAQHPGCRQTLTVEIGRPEADESDLVLSAISLADFKLDSPERVTCLSLRYQIAQKIHAVTEEPADGRLNLRHWDLIDLILLRALLEEDLWHVREACIWTFEDRNTHNWPPTLKVPDAWSESYRFDVSQIKAGLPEDVQAAAEAVAEFIAAIDVARLGAH
jgi:hypothetical protein